MFTIEFTPFGYIYKLTNILNGKTYIGQTRNLKRRMSEYANRNSVEKKSKYHIMEVINSFGFENFLCETLDICIDQNEMDELERRYILLNNSIDDRFGYNRSMGRCKSLNIQTRIRMSNSHRGLTETADTKRKKSSPVIAFKSNECVISDSAKLFGDFIGMGKDKVKNALRMPCRIRGFYIFYMEPTKRNIINYKTDAHLNFLKLIDEGVETIETLYHIRYLRYSE